MFHIPYDLLMLKKKETPCYFDTKNPNSLSPVQCVCDQSTRFTKKDKMLKCTVCEKFSHEQCTGLNSKMKKFICATCQLVIMDPLFKPVMTLIPPFIVHKYCDRKEDPKHPRFPNEAKKPFEFDS